MKVGGGSILEYHKREQLLFHKIERILQIKKIRTHSIFWFF